MINYNKSIPKFTTIKELLYHSATVFSSNVAFTEKVKKDNNINYINHTYLELLDDINSFGTALYKLGLKNKRVAIIGHNCYKWAIAHLSNLLGGIVSVPLDKGLQTDELENSLIRSEASAIVFDAKLKDIIEEIKASNKTNIKHFICFDELPNFLCFNNLLSDGKKEIENGNNAFINCEVDPYNMSILLFTSGTTSQSKAVMLNQYGIVTNIYDMLLVESFYETDVNIAFLPFHHIFGSTGMLVMLAAGLKTVFPDGLRYIKQNLLEYKVSVFVGVPILIDKMYSTMIKEIEKQGKTKLINFAIKISNILLKFHIDIRRKIFKELINALGGNMRFIVSGGAPLDSKVSKWFNQIGIHLVQGYGLTETSPVISAENDNCIKYGSVGKPMNSVEILIKNPDSNGIGEIAVKGPNVMLGYYNNETQTNAVLKDGWFYTGDLGYIDKDGFLFITGRKKDLIVLKNGKKVFPEEIELLINRLDEVEESFVYGLPDRNDKNDVKVAVKIVYNKDFVNNKYPDISEKDLEAVLWAKIKDINKTLPMYKYIKHMTFTSEPLIKTTTNKIKRNEELKQILTKEENNE
jgi:long-chain acyl-CoA synthetase